MKEEKLPIWERRTWVTSAIEWGLSNLDRYIGKVVDYIFGEDIVENDHRKPNRDFGRAYRRTVRRIQAERTEQPRRYR